MTEGLKPIRAVCPTCGEVFTLRESARKRLLDFLPDGQEIRWKPLEEWSREARIPQSTLSSILKELVAEGIVQKRKVRALPPRSYYKKVDGQCQAK